MSCIRVGVWVIQVYVVIRTPQTTCEVSAFHTMSEYLNSKKKKKKKSWTHIFLFLLTFYVFFKKFFI